MGMFDTFDGNCPTCGQHADAQTKFIPSLELGEATQEFFVVGRRIKGIPTHEFSIELSNCYNCKCEMFAHLSDGVYRGFGVEPKGEVLYSDKARRQAITDCVMKTKNEVRRDKR